MSATLLEQLAHRPPVAECAFKQPSPVDQSTNAMAAAVEKVCVAVLREAACHPHDFYKSDVSRVATSEWAVKRFIVRAHAVNGEGDVVEQATQDLVHNLMWRKEVRVLERAESTFPDDFFRARLLGAADCPRTDNKVIYINTKVYRKIPELTEHLFAFGHTLLDRLDREANGKRFTLFLDLSDLQLANADVHFLRYFLDLMTHRFPLMLQRTYLYEAAWYIRPLVSLVLKVFPKGLLKNVSLLDKQSAIQLLGLDGIPEGAGGCLCTDIPVPALCPAFADFSLEHGIPTEAMQRARREYNLL